MKKLKYLFQRIKNMHFGQMIAQAKIVHKRTGRLTLFVIIDMVWCGFKYLAGYMDYVVFGFYDLNAKQRATHVTRGRNNEFVHTFNSRDSWHKFENKTEFNVIFADFIRRDWLDLREASKDDFTAFVAKHPVFIAKPVDGLCGHGVEKITLTDKAESGAVFDRLTANGQFLVEDYVRQHDDLMRLFPNSVNTLRLVTINCQGRVTPVFCGIRIGVGDSVVDNINSGGLAAVIDLETGTIKTPAADKDGNVFERHPDTGTQIKGFVIPKFAEALEMVKKAALVVPEIGYAAWDVSVTNDTVLLIEGNHFPGHDIYQMPCHLTDGYGILPVLRAAAQAEKKTL